MAIVSLSLPGNFCFRLAWFLLLRIFWSGNFYFIAIAVFPAAGWLLIFWRGNCCIFRYCGFLAALRLSGWRWLVCGGYAIYHFIMPIVLLGNYFNVKLHRFAQNQPVMYKVSPVTVFEDEHGLYGTKIGKDNKNLPLTAIAMGATEEESRQMAEKIAKLLNASEK